MGKGKRRRGGEGGRRRRGGEGGRRRRGGEGGRRRRGGEGGRRRRGGEGGRRRRGGEGGRRGRGGEGGRRRRGGEGGRRRRGGEGGRRRRGGEGGRRRRGGEGGRRRRGGEQGRRRRGGEGGRRRRGGEGGREVGRRWKGRWEKGKRGKWERCMHTSAVKNVIPNDSSFCSLAMNLFCASCTDTCFRVFIACVQIKQKYLCELNVCAMFTCACGCTFTTSWSIPAVWYRCSGRTPLKSSSDLMIRR